MDRTDVIALTGVLNTFLEDWRSLRRDIEQIKSDLTQLKQSGALVRNQPPQRERQLVVGWKGLQEMGWTYSRAHTWRLMFDAKYADDPFPKCSKIGSHMNSHPMWRMAEVLAYFEAHKLHVTSD